MESREPRGRILALDYGEARIGVALSDPLGITAQPLPTLERRGDKQVAREVAALVRDRHVVEVVIGLPLELSGDEGPAAQAARAFADRLRNHVQGVPVTLWDERLTSVQAERALRDGGADWRKRRQNVDQVAAALILQSVLDSRRPLLEEA